MRKTLPFEGEKHLYRRGASVFMRWWRGCGASLRAFVLVCLAAATIYGGGKGDGGNGGGGDGGDPPDRGMPTFISGGSGTGGNANPTSPVATDYAAFSNLCFTSIAVSSTNAVLGIGWNALTNTLAVLDIYAKTNLLERLWRHLAEMDVDTDDDEAVAELPLSWLGNPPSAFFNLGERLDSDGDGLPDAFENLATGSNPTKSDTDGDGLGDGEEYAQGTNPSEADTDGDGIDDGEEQGYVRTTELIPCDMVGTTNLLEVISNHDSGKVSVPLPFPIWPPGADVCSNLVIGIDGRLALATGTGTSLPSRPSSTRPMIIRAFDDDLEAYTNELESALFVATFGTNGVRRFVVEYRSFGFYGLEPVETNSVSFQVSFAEDEPDVVRVCYFHVGVVTDDLSSRALGDSAKLDLRTARCSLEFSDQAPVVHPGLAIEYRIGAATDPTMSDTDGDGLDDGEEIRIYGTDPLAADTDNDGLGDGQELQLGTDPLRSDTDGDGMPDGWEFANWLNPLSAADAALDADLDGLTNLEEYFLGTNPQTSYTDGDGLTDFVEMQLGTNPLAVDTDGDGLDDDQEIPLGTNPCLADTDGDGLVDGQESAIGTNPLSADSDSDGMPDGWEVLHGLNPFANDAALDADGDGLSNFTEYGSGTNPSEEDTDCDGLDDGAEATLGTNPLQPDTDGDGMDDGWENAHGFDPTTDNARTARTDDDFDADPDNDGLTNGEECAYGSNPTPPHSDTDGDGVSDGDEVVQGTDPADGSDGGSVTNVVRVQFEFGDYSGSESEKYRLEIKPVNDNRSAPKTLRFLNQRYDGTDTFTVPLAPGREYEIRLRHASTDPGYFDYPEADYDYRLLMTPLETPARVILDDPDELFGRSKSNQDATFTTSPKVAHLYVLEKPKMVADYDRNGDIDSADETLAAGGRTLRFWINDDADGDGGNGNYSTSTTADIPGSSSPDFGDSTVNGRCDLIDFTPVFINAECLSILPQEIRGDLVFRLRQSNGAVNAVWSSIGKGDVGSFQTSDTATCGPSLNSSPRNAATARVTTTGITVPSAFADRLFSSSTHGGVLFIEGRAATSAPLCLDIEYDYEVIATATLPLSLSSVEKMFWSYSIRGAENGGNFTLPENYTPDNLMPDLGNKTVFFLHGLSVGVNESHGWSSEMFKRLWQSGSNARFVSVTWFGNYNWFGNWASGLRYHDNALNAFMSADALKSLVEREQSSSGNRVLMAHSLGNMVVCEALRKGLSVGKYFMLDAAVPSEAIDGTLQGATPQDDAYQKYVPSDWHGYTNLSWASNWHTWFGDDPDDARGKMGWPDFFSDALGNVGTVYNYYSTGDPVFMETATPPGNLTGVFHWQTLGFSWPFVDLDITAELYCWQKQESRKGISAISGTQNGGWGFRIWDANPPNEGVMLTNYTAEAAAAMVADGSITNSSVFSTAGTSLNNPNATEADIREALAKHVPAVSSAVGKTGCLNQYNFDLNNPTDVPRPNEWGRSHDVFHSFWLHSDIKEMAFFYVYKFFEQIVQGGSLQ